MMKLKNEAQPCIAKSGQCFILFGEDIVAIYTDLAAIRPVECAKDMKKSTFAGTRCTDYGYDLSPLHGE